ncbi:MAG: hypothetical protein KBS83_05345, partial [Lachnospiraceae bacterium]|nr:hypothetical protein [Candidatus Equihabitans merdae]MBQ0059365.1 hypothetical protein [Candidatus Equihabitans merdae]
TSFENAQIESAVEITTVKGGLHGYKSRFTATYEGQSILYVVYTLEDGSNYYRLSFWTSASNAATEEPIFSAIADQFSVIG